jgi:hypothetical protein
MKSKQASTKVAAPSESGKRVAALAAAAAASRPDPSQTIPAPVPRKRGRPPKNGVAAQAKAPKGKPGRPANPNKMSITKRTALYDQSIRESGGRVLNRLRLASEASSALDIILSGEESIRSSIEAALIHYAEVVSKKKPAAQA